MSTYTQHDEQILTVNEDLWREFFDRGTWFRVKKTFLQQLDPMSALMLSYLINVTTSRRPGEGGWWELKVSDVESEIGFKKRQQRAALAELEAEKLVQVARRFDGRFFTLDRGLIWRKFIARGDEMVVAKTSSREDENVPTVGTDPSPRARLVGGPKKGKRKKPTTGPAAGGADRGFFPEGGVDPWDLGAAKRLISILQEHSALTQRAQARRWAREFERMRVQFCIPKKRIKAALLWYGEHFGEMFVPQVTTAREFRLKFPKMEAQMGRAVGAEPPDEVELTPKMEELLDRLRSDLPWPAKARLDELPLVVAKSWEAFKVWVRAHEALLERYHVREDENQHIEHDEAPGLSTVLRFAFNLSVMFDRQPRTYLLSWFKQRLKGLHGWEDWSGSLRGITWSETHRDFVHWGETRAREYSNDAKLWRDYMRALHGD